MLVCDALGSAKYSVYMPPASKSGKKLTASPKAKAGGAVEWKNPIHENGFISVEINMFEDSPPVTTQKVRIPECIV